VAFEKASVLFNIGALYTQIGTRQDRGTSKGLDAAVDNFLRAAGTFQVKKPPFQHPSHLKSTFIFFHLQYIHENFTNAPSMDLSPATLEFLTHLMCAQVTI